MKLDRAPRPTLSLAPGGPSLALGRAHEATGPAAIVFAALAAGRMRGPVLWIRPARGSGALNPEGLSAFFDPARLVIASADRPADILWTAEEALRSGAAPLVVAEPTAPPALTPLRRLQLAAEAGGEAARRLAGAPLADGAGARRRPDPAPPAAEDRDVLASLPNTMRGRDRWRNDAPGASAAPPRATSIDRAPPLCLLLPPGPGTAGAVESRWRCAPRPAWTADDGGVGGGQRSEARWRFERIYAKSAPPMVWEADAAMVRG